MAHTDMPDFSLYRKTPKAKGEGQTADNSRKNFTYLMVAGESVVLMSHLLCGVCFQDHSHYISNKLHSC